jgi:glutamate 5-kinase
MEKLGYKTRPQAITQKQATAAVGQTRLMNIYEDYFARYQQMVAQVLLTHDDLSHRRRFLNARNTVLTLLELGIIPIINENDTVVVDEIKFGDNDNLSAMVSILVDADLLVMCNGCYETLAEADAALRHDHALRGRVEQLLAGIGTRYEGEESASGTSLSSCTKRWASGGSRRRRPSRSSTRKSRKPRSRISEEL